MTVEDRKSKAFLLKTLPQLINKLEFYAELNEIELSEMSEGINKTHFSELHEKHKNDISNLKKLLIKTRR